MVAVLTPPMSVDLLDDLEHDLDADAIYFVTTVDELAARRYDRIGVHLASC